jgi:sRNA-binding protein
MNFEDGRANMPEAQGKNPGADAHDMELDEALKNFRATMRAWSEAELSRPRAAKTVRQRSWRLAAGWALGCALVAGGVSGGVYERHHRQEAARAAAEARAAEQQRLAAEQQARETEEDLLAKVDSDIAREVPSAMEPLAQLMGEDESK